MGRTVKDPNRRQPKPVQKVQLSEKNVGRRIVLVVLFLAIGSGFLVYGFMNFLRGDSGSVSYTHLTLPTKRIV